VKHSLRNTEENQTMPKAKRKAKQIEKVEEALFRVTVERVTVHRTVVEVRAEIDLEDDEIGEMAEELVEDNPNTRWTPIEDETEYEGLDVEEVTEETPILRLLK
jgi:hypothetical protein